MIFFLVILLFSGCATKIIYKCPKGQVAVMENYGTDLEREVCYEPGVSYTDYRPMQTKQIKELSK